MSRPLSNRILDGGLDEDDNVAIARAVLELASRQPAGDPPIPGLDVARRLVSAADAGMLDHLQERVPDPPKRAWVPPAPPRDAHGRPDAGDLLDQLSRRPPLSAGQLTNAHLDAIERGEIQ